MTRVIYFDGECILCNRMVKFILNHDKKKVFSFATLQSAYAIQHISHANGQYTKKNTVVLQEKDQFFIKSTAVLKILEHLGGIWKFFLVVKCLPISWRDGLYDIVAKNRFRWFGKRDQCIVPTSDIASRFLD